VRRKFYIKVTLSTLLTFVMELEPIPVAEQS